MTSRNIQLCIKFKKKQITRTLRSLVFSPYKELRQHALQFFDGRDDFQKLVELLFLEEVQEYFPVGRLTIHHYLTPSTEQTNYWLSMPGRLKNSKFTACVYIPSRENLIISNKSKFVEKKDLLKRNHIQMLCRLHHPNIATLYAFNMDCMPEFYIQEQHGEEFSENLQQYLVNRSQSNNSLCTTITLIQILLDAAAALKFCHDKDIILRDITAASFIVVHKNVVKLSEFSLAIDLCGKSQIKDKHIDYNQLPTRWSAVESLRWLIWSKQSDVWMFGVLMFEVLTHGLLPYSHLKLKDEDLFRNLTKPSIQLRHEECMSLAHYEVILQCTEKDPMKRPNISQIEESLNELVEKEKTRPTPLWTKYPDLNDPEYKPSTKLRKGIPKTRSSEGLYQFHRSLSDGLKEYTIPNKSKYLFRHKSRRNFPEALLEKINQGLFAAVLPAIEVTVVKQDSQEMGDVFIVDVTVQKHLDGNVLEMVFNKTLGYSARDFRQLLLKIASLIDSLHKLMVVLGSIRASQLYVHRISETDFMCI
uniref:Protein kinase domain-containing protein n=1 Tax=Biomphalaria glabrata TaxID=6526 RepID=A0A2C9M123_BIOGL